MTLARITRLRPICAVCGKPVERLTEERDAFMGRVVFRAHCHGRSERVDTDECELGGPVAFGLAFAGDAKRLEAAQ